MMGYDFQRLSVFQIDTVDLQNDPRLQDRSPPIHRHNRAAVLAITNASGDVT